MAVTMSVALAPGRPAAIVLVGAVLALAAVPLGLGRARRVGARAVDVHRALSALAMGVLGLLAAVPAASATTTSSSGGMSHGATDPMLLLGLPYVLLTLWTIVAEGRSRRIGGAVEALAMGAAVVVMARM